MGKKEDPQSSDKEQYFADSSIPVLTVHRITHDLNNLVCGILGLCEAAASGRNEPRRQDKPRPREFSSMDSGSKKDETSELFEIEWAARQAALLLQQLADLCKEKESAARIVYPGEVISSSAGVLKRMLGEEVHFDFEIRENGYPVRMEPGRLEQVVLNLVLNARDATPRGGVVSLKLENLPADQVPDVCFSSREFNGDSIFVKIEVKDNGHGVLSHHRERIFEPYFTTKYGKNSSGLGLSTVKKIVEEAGGRIDLKSGPKSGTVFSIYLPVVKQITQ